MNRRNPNLSGEARPICPQCGADLGRARGVTLDLREVGLIRWVCGCGAESWWTRPVAGWQLERWAAGESG